jgi:hypothetical protein
MDPAAPAAGSNIYLSGTSDDIENNVALENALYVAAAVNDTLLDNVANSEYMYYSQNSRFENNSVVDGLLKGYYYEEGALVKDNIVVNGDLEDDYGVGNTIVGNVVLDGSLQMLRDTNEVRACVPACVGAAVLPVGGQPAGGGRRAAQHE